MTVLTERKFFYLPLTPKLERVLSYGWIYIYYIFTIIYLSDIYLLSVIYFIHLYIYYLLYNIYFFTIYVLYSSNSALT